MRKQNLSIAALILAFAVIGCTVGDKPKKQTDLTDKSPEYFYNLSYYRFMSHHDAFTDSIGNNDKRAQNNYVYAREYLVSLRKYLDTRDPEKASQMQALIDRYSILYKDWDKGRNYAFVRPLNKVRDDVLHSFSPDKIIPNYSVKKEKEESDKAKGIPPKEENKKKSKEKEVAKPAATPPTTATPAPQPTPKPAPAK